MERNKFLHAIEKVKPAASSAGEISITPHIFLSGKDLVAYNNRIAIQYPFKTDFSFFVDSSALHKIVSKLSVDNITLSKKDNTLNIKSKELHATLLAVEDEGISKKIKLITKAIKKAKWKNLQDDFCKSISMCASSTVKKDSTNTLSCVNISGNICVSSDNNRVAKAVMSEEMDSMLIQASEIQILTKINPKKYAITKSWLHFKGENGCIMSIRKIVGEFPDFTPFFDFDGESVNLPKNISEGMDVASIFVDEVDPVISVKIKNNYCFLTVTSDGGTIKQRTKIKYNKKEINFFINPEFLKQMIGYSSTLIIAKDKMKLESDKFSLLTLFYTS